MNFVFFWFVLSTGSFVVYDPPSFRPNSPTVTPANKTHPSLTGKSVQNELRIFCFVKNNEVEHATVSFAPPAKIKRVRLSAQNTKQLIPRKVDDCKI